MQWLGRVQANISGPTASHKIDPAASSLAPLVAGLICIGFGAGVVMIGVLVLVRRRRSG